MRRFVFAAFALTVLAACQPATNELTDYQKAEIAAEVDMVMDQWWGVWGGDLDFERGMSFFTDEPETGWAYEGQALLTKPVLDAAWRPFFAALQSQSVTPIDSRTIVLASDMAYTTRTVSVVRVDTSGTEHPAVQFAETIVWVKRNGEWKVLTGHGSEPNESM